MSPTKLYYRIHDSVLVASASADDACHHYPSIPLRNNPEEPMNTSPTASLIAGENALFVTPQLNDIPEHFSFLADAVNYDGGIPTALTLLSTETDNTAALDDLDKLEIYRSQRRYFEPASNDPDKIRDGVARKITSLLSTRDITCIVTLEPNQHREDLRPIYEGAVLAAQTKLKESGTVIPVIVPGSKGDLAVSHPVDVKKEADALAKAKKDIKEKGSTEVTVIPAPKEYYRVILPALTGHGMQEQQALAS